MKNLLLKHKKKIIGAIISLLMGGSITISLDGIRIDMKPISDKHGDFPGLDKDGNKYPGMYRF